MYVSGNSRQYEQAAAEYLTAFITHLYNKGLNTMKICEKLEVDPNLINKLIKDERIIEGLEKRIVEFAGELKKQYPDEEQFKKVLREYSLHYYDFNNKYYLFTGFIKNIGPWQRKHQFTNAIDYHFKNKKRYTNNDIDVLATLSTPTTPADAAPDNFSDRQLTPAYQFRIVNEIYDGYSVKEISEKYNCSELAVNIIADEQHITIPVTADSIRIRIIQAIKEGYNLEQLTRRFKYFDAEEIKELIKTHRILSIV